MAKVQEKGIFFRKNSLILFLKMCLIFDLDTHTVLRPLGWIGCVLKGSQDFFHISAWLCIINGMSKMTLPTMCSNFSHFFNGNFGQMN